MFWPCNLKFLAAWKWYLLVLCAAYKNNHHWAVNLTAQPKLIFGIFLLGKLSVILAKKLIEGFKYITPELFQYCY